MFTYLRFIIPMGFFKYAYETSDRYILVGSWEIDIKGVMLNEYRIDIEEDPEYEEGKWDDPSFLERMKRKYPEVFREYDEPLKILRELSKEGNIVVKELIDKTGIMNFEIGKKISSDRISILKELLEAMRKAYMKALNIDEERMKVKKNENYYRQISKMRELIYRARKIVLRLKKENKPINTILISNASKDFKIEIL